MLPPKTVDKSYHLSERAPRHCHIYYCYYCTSAMPGLPRLPSGTDRSYVIIRCIRAWPSSDWCVPTYAHTGQVLGRRIEIFGARSIDICWIIQHAIITYGGCVMAAVSAGLCFTRPRERFRRADVNTKGARLVIYLHMTCAANAHTRWVWTTHIT